MFKVYGLPRTRMSRVVWMLEEVEADYEMVKVAPQSKEARALNPSGKIPVLEYKNELLFDSVAICGFLADLYPEKELTFEIGSIERAKLESFVQFSVSEMEDALWWYLRHSSLFPEEKRVAGVLPVAQQQYVQACQDLEQRLEAGPFLFGERFTVADLHFGFLASWAEGMQFPNPPERIKMYFSTCRKRKALIKAAKAERDMS